MKTLSTILFALSFGFVPVSYSKNCQPHVRCHQGNNTYQVNFIDTIVDSEAALYNPFYMSYMGCDPMSGCTWGCSLDSFCCWFNGTRIGNNDPLPLSSCGVLGVLNDTFYFVPCCGGQTIFSAQMIIHIQLVNVTENFLSSQLNIFPDPFLEMISFKMKDPSVHLLNIQIYDFTGKLLEEINNRFYNIEMKKEDSGIYFYAAYADNGKFFEEKLLSNNFLLN